MTPEERVEEIWQEFYERRAGGVGISAAVREIAVALAATEAEAKDWQAKYADADMARFQAEALAGELAEALRNAYDPHSEDCAARNIVVDDPECICGVRALIARYDERAKGQTLAGVRLEDLHKPVTR